MAYATINETYLLALTARAFEVVPSPIVMVDINTGKIRLPSNGYGAADLLLFSCTSGGSLPPELDPFTYYSPIVIGGDVFQVADPSTGAPIPFSADPKGWAVKVDSSRRLQIHLDDAQARIDQRLGAHKAPILPDPVTGKYPDVLRGLNARMGARSAVTSLQLENAAYRTALDRLFAMAATDGDTDPPGQPGSLLGDYANGLSVLPAPLDGDTVPNMGPRATNRLVCGAARSRWERGTL